METLQDGHHSGTPLSLPSLSSVDKTVSSIQGLYNLKTRQLLMENQDVSSGVSTYRQYGDSNVYYFVNNVNKNFSKVEVQFFEKFADISYDMELCQIRTIPYSWQHIEQTEK